MGEKQKTQMHQLQSEPAEGSRETIERELDRQDSRPPRDKAGTKPKAESERDTKKRRN